MSGPRPAAAILADERDMVALSVSDVRRHGADLVFDVQLCAVAEPDEAAVPFLRGRGHRAPAEEIARLLDDLARLADCRLSALRFDPVGDGLHIEVDAAPGGGFEVALWLDLTRTSPAMKARAVRGRHQAGLRLFTTADRLAGFRAALFALAFSARGP